MSNPAQGGWTGRFAYNAAVLAAFIDTHRDKRRIERRVKRGARIYLQHVYERWVNGRPWAHDTHGRMLNRWLRGTAPSKASVTRLLAVYRLTTDEFERWAKEQGLNPVLRDHTDKEDTDVRKKNRRRQAGRKSGAARAVPAPAGA